MSKKKTPSKTSRTSRAARGVPPGSSPGGNSTPPSETLQAAAHRDPRDGTAVIAPVTDAALDHAAHEAADLAEGIARHAAALQRTTEPVVKAVADSPPETPDEAAGAELGVAAVGDTPLSAAEALRRYNAKLIAMMRTNAASTTALFAALVQARSVPEALSINADHLRRQMATLTDQGTELATLARGIAGDTLRSFKDATKR